jgi:hypothetical protein
MQKKTLLYVCTALIMLASCNNESKETETTSKDSTNANTTDENSIDKANMPVMANINVTITGGEMAGTYTASCKEGCCSWGIAGEKIFGNQYSETGKSLKELSSVQLVVDDVTSTGKKTTNEFLLTVGFGELFSDTNGRSLNIDTKRNKGSGTVELDYQGDKAFVTIKGTSAEGPTIDLKMECTKVVDPKNLGY